MDSLPAERESKREAVDKFLADCIKREKECGYHPDADLPKVAVEFVGSKASVMGGGIRLALREHWRKQIEKLADEGGVTRSEQVSKENYLPSQAKSTLPYNILQKGEDVYVAITDDEDDEMGVSSPEFTPGKKTPGKSPFFPKNFFARPSISVLRDALN